MLPLQILGGRYRLEKTLGVGGMSVVWQATDQVLRRTVAVKILAGDYALDVAREAVLSEAQAVARLSHPNICSVHDYGESLQPDGTLVPYIVMELINGPSLADRLKQGSLPTQQALTIAAEVAAGLAEAHAHEVVHRDVKPGNVLLTQSGAKVIDFGIAATVGSPDERPDGRIVATPAYVAPERLTGATVLPPSDMFGWGVLLYRMITGKLPWPSFVPLHGRLSALEPLPVMPGIPGTIGDLFLSCVDENPDERPTAASAAAVVRVALAVRTPQASDVFPVGPPPAEPTESVSLRASADAERRRRRRRAVLLAAALIAVLGTTAFAFNNRDRFELATPPPLATTTPTGAGVVGTDPAGGSRATPTQIPAGDPPAGALPGREVAIPGVPGPVVTVTVTVTSPGGNPQPQPQPIVGPATSFPTKGGTVVAVCDTYGPRITSITPEPGYYPNEVSLVVVAFAFFTRPADGTGPAMTYRLTLQCASSTATPTATVASYTGDQLVTASPGAPSP